jgi:molybdopterin converting factor small subunit
MRLEVKLFGPLRPFASAGALEVELREGASARDAREAVAVALERASPGPAVRGILARSVVADEDDVLAEDAPLPAGTRSLAILPPVCGG